MNSIPHKLAFVQASFYENNDNSIFQGNKSNFPVYHQSQALALYDAGLNVFPQPYGRKAGYAWKRLQYTRLHRENGDANLMLVTAGECNLAVMCGRTSGNLFVLDCESAEAFEYHLAHLQQRQVPLWAARTARGGHIYLRCVEGEVRNIEPGRMKDAELRGQHGYVLAPPSLHPSGVVYEWVHQQGDAPPQVSASLIDWLTEADGTPLKLDVEPYGPSALPETLSVLSPASALSRKTRDYIKNGHLIPEGTRNNRLFSAACDLQGNDYSQDEAIRILLPVADGSGLEMREILATIDSAYSQQRDPAGRNLWAPPRSTLWQYALIWVANQLWSGAGKVSERTLLLAMVERARLSANERGTFRASIREIAVLGRMGTATVQRTLTRLTTGETPILRKCGRDRLSGATLWQFSEHILNAGQALANRLMSLPRHWLQYMRALFSSDASERGALGHNGMYLYQVMLAQETPLMPSELAEAAGMTLNQVNYALKKMREMALVARDETGWRAIAVADDELAQRAPTQGKGEQRRERFALERRLYKGRILFDERWRKEGNQFIEAARYLMWLLNKVTLEQFKEPLLVTLVMLGGVILPSDDTALLPPDFPLPQRE